MKMRRCIGLALASAIAVSGLGNAALAAETQTDDRPIITIERASGNFNTTVSAGKIKTLGSAISLQGGEVVSFDATYSPLNASVDFGILDSNNVFYYINATNGKVDGGVEVPANGSYTPAIRNNSSSSISVSGTVGSYKPSSK